MNLEEIQERMDHCERMLKQSKFNPDQLKYWLEYQEQLMSELERIMEK